MYQTYVYDKISNPNYSKELSAQKGKAKKGIDPISTLEYGTACLYGNIKGVKQDLPLALKYAQQVSEKGLPDGKILYGIMKLYGVGTPKDVPGAFNEFLQATQRNSNNLDAQYLLAYSFLNEDFKEIPSNAAVQYMINAGTQDKHNIRQAQGELGKLYLDGKFCQQNLSMAIRYLTQSANTYGPAQEYLAKCFNFINITNLFYNSKPKKIHQAYLKLVKENRNLPESEEMLVWAHNLDYPPAMFDFAQLNISRGNENQYFRELIEKAAHRLYLPAIDTYVYRLMSENNFTEAVKYAKYSIYFKSNVHQNTIAVAYRSAARETVDPGIYFRYRKYYFQTNNNPDVFDSKLTETCKFSAMKDGNAEETYYYAVCLENGFGELEADPEGAVELYKKAASLGHQSAGRNYAHFLEFGEYCAQDFGLAIKKIENIFNDIEALTTLNFLRNMNSGDFSVPFQYQSAFKKLQMNQVGPNGDIFMINIKIAKLLTKNEFMIPNFKYAEKYADKGKKRYPLGFALLGFIYYDPSSASKPNPKKAEKMFMEASLNSSDKEIAELYAQFLISEGREAEANALGVKSTTFSSTIERQKMATSMSSKRPGTPAQLTNGEDLYKTQYPRETNPEKKIRILERAALGNHPPAQTEYAAHIISKSLKKEYRLAITMLESASGEDISNGTKNESEGKEIVLTAYLYLGYMYYKGLGLKTDYKKAIEFYIKAIDGLEYAGYYGLSLCYAKGNGLPKDPYMAYRYWQIASQTTPYQRPLVSPINIEMFPQNECLELYNTEIAHLVITDLNLNGNNKNRFTYGFYNEIIKKDYTTAFDDYAKVVESTKQSDKMYHVFKRSLAYLKMKSLGCEKLYQEAKDTFEELANNCSSSSTITLDDTRNAKYCEWKHESGMPFWMSKEVQEVYQLTKDYFNNILEEKPVDPNPSFLIKYADYCFNGTLVDQDYHTSLNMYKVYGQVVRDNPKIYLQIAYQYENSLGARFNNDIIGAFYDKAARLDDVEGLYKAAQMMLRGNGLPKDLYTANLYNKKAANKNNQGAIKDLTKFREAIASRKDVVDPYEEWLVPIPVIEFKRLKLKNVRIQITPLPSLCLKPLEQILDANPVVKFGILDDQVLLEKGIRSMKGLGMKRSYNEALNYFGQSVLKGNIIARIYFAVLCRICKVEKYAQIYAYNMYKAKMNGCSLAYIEEAKVELGKYNKNVNPDLRIEVNDQSREKAARLLQYAIDSGDIYARYIKGRYLQDKDTLEQTAEDGFGKSLYYIGKKLLDTGRSSEAFTYMEKSALTNHSKALFFLGIIYLIRGNSQLAEPLLIRAKESGNSTLCVRYGRERLPSEGRLHENPAEAFAMFQFAHDIGNINGTYYLAECHRLGIGTNKDLATAASLLEIGCKLELPEFFEAAVLCYSEMKGPKNWMTRKKYESKNKKVILGKYKIAPIEDYSFVDISPNSVYYPRYTFALAMSHKLIDINKYRLYLQISTNLGVFSAIKETVYQLIGGLYLKRNLHLAFTLLHQLMDIGWGTAYKLMGDIHFAASGAVFSHQIAFHMYKKSAVLGSKSGKYKLGYAFIQGIGCKRNLFKGFQMMDNSGCKYAYHYLSNYTSYSPKVCQPTPNCLESNLRIANDKGCIDDVKLAAHHDLRWGIIIYQQYFWGHDRGMISPMSMMALKKVAQSGSAEASFQYGFAHYVMGKEHYNRAISFLELPADEDNYSACHYLGRIYNTSGYFVPNLAIKYLEKSAINLNNVEDMWILGTELHKGETAVNWMAMAADKDDSHRWELANILMEGWPARDIRKNPNKAAIYLKMCESLTYDQKMRRAALFYLGELVPKELDTARQYFKILADSYNRPDETATKIYIEMCIKGQGGSTIEPWAYIKQVADSNDPDRRKYCKHYGWHMDDLKQYEDAIWYYEKSGDAECLERARLIREYLEAKRREEEARRRQAEQQKKDDNSMLGGALILGIGLMLLTGIPPPI